MTYTYTAPIYTLLNQSPVLWWESGRATTKKLTDVANVCDAAALILY